MTTSPTLNENTYRICTAVWNKALAFDGIDPAEKFIVFSKNNPYEAAHSLLHNLSYGWEIS